VVSEGGLDKELDISIHIGMHTNGNSKDVTLRDQERFMPESRYESTSPKKPAIYSRKSSKFGVDSHQISEDEHDRTKELSNIFSTIKVESSSNLRNQRS
jgi:hypothetical protein